MLGVLIVDDEPLARQAMRRLLVGHSEVEVLGEAETLAEAIAATERLRPQLVFLDIELGGDDGFDFLGALVQPPIVAFVTAYAQYAVDAFAVDAIDYLLKPVEPERLAECLGRVERRLEKGPLPARSRESLVELRTPRRTVLANPREIVVLRADDDFTRVSVAHQPELMIWRTLAHFERLLPSPPFLRLDRSLILNRDRVRDIRTPSRDLASVTLDGLAEPIALGRTAAQRLREALK
jgi:two-component system LytT family response regulator